MKRKKIKRDLYDLWFCLGFSIGVIAITKFISVVTNVLLLQQ